VLKFSGVCEKYSVHIVIVAAAIKIINEVKITIDKQMIKVTK
jgi:hypothetical protein